MTKEIIGDLELNRVYQRDCLEGMRLIPDDSVNLIVIDPPYNIGKDARWDKWDTVDKYVRFMCDVFAECERVLKPSGSFYFFHNDMTQIRKLMDAMDNTTFVFKQLITWNKIDPSFKNHGYVQQRLSIDMMRNYYNGFTEYCVYYTFQEDPKNNVFSDSDIFKPIINYLRSEFKKSRDAGFKTKQIRELCGLNVNAGGIRYFAESVWIFPPKDHYLAFQRTGFFQRTYEDLLSEYEELRREYESTRYLFNTATVKDDLRANSNVWLYPPAPKQGHITPKPVEMIENIIRHSSKEGDVVLDCFMGSGTTAVASARLNRKYIGFERESEYIQISNQRLESIFDTKAERKLME